MKGLNTVQ